MPFDTPDFTNRNVAVTGGSRGIGAAIVRAFAEAGANVWFTYRSDAGAAEALADELSAAHPDQSFTARQCDVSDAEDVTRFYDECLDELESFDVLVNNAGVTADGLMVTMDGAQWSKVIDTNLTGVFNMTQKVLFKFLRQKSGNIINISSVAGVYGNAGQSNYAATKSGIIGMTKSLSKEMAARNVRVNALAPGFIDTDMTAAMNDADRAKIVDKIGLRRMGHTDDVANAAVFLASDHAAYITGQTLVIDGGLVI